jgi:hypothetical protein
MIPPTRTAAARIAKAIQPHCVLLESSFSEAAAAAAAAAAAGLTPDVVVAGGGEIATTVVVWDSVTVGVGIVGVDRVGVGTVGVDRVGVGTVGVDRVGVVRVPALVSVPPTEPSPPPHAARKPTANNGIIAAAPRQSNGNRIRLVTTHAPSHSRVADPSPDPDEAQAPVDHPLRMTCRVSSCDMVCGEAHERSATACAAEALAATGPSYRGRDPAAYELA